MAAPETATTYRIRKYPNRRYYNATHSRHITLEGLFELVRNGSRIVVTDSNGDDITNIVLTQIILEHDPPKLRLFSADLLHQTIQANQHMIGQFIDQYFSQAMSAFGQSREHFDQFLKRSGLSPLQPSTPLDWAQTFLRSFTGQSPSTDAQPEPAPADELGEVRAEIERLRSELDRLRAPSKAQANRRKPGTKAKKVKKKTARPKRRKSP